MRITCYGHSCFGLYTGGRHLLFDPFITPNKLAANVDVDTIPADYILVTHGHNDHTADLIRVAKRTGATVIAAYELTEWVKQQGHDNVHPMNTGGSWNFDFGILTATVAHHSSSLADGTYAGNPMGFIVQSDNRTLYNAGDTALTLDMQLIARRYDLDIALLPIGSNFTMDYVDAAIAAGFLQVSRVIGMHYDTFPYIKLDHRAARDHFSANSLQLVLMEIGKTMEI